MTPPGNETVAPAAGGWRALHDRRASRLLALLLASDLLFIALHVVYYLTPWLDVRFDLGMDRGFPELFGYLKFLAIAALLEGVRRFTGCNGYFAWILVFLVLFLDDAAKIHEGLGRLIAAHLAFEPPFNLRRQDLGELAAAAVSGILLLLAAGWAYWRSSDVFRKVSRDMLLLIAILVFCGVFVDMAHTVFEDRSLAAGAVGIVEDGGEMISASLMLWYAVLLALRRGDPGVFLLDLLLGRHRRPRRRRAGAGG